jgi:protein-disulfide isomerase
MPATLDAFTTGRSRQVMLALAGAGWLACAYLLLRMAAIGSVRLSFGDRVAVVSPGTALDDFLASPGAFVGSYPLPVVGLVYFALVLLLLVVNRRGSQALAVVLLILLCGAGLAAAVLRPELGSDGIVASYAAAPRVDLPLESSDAVLGSGRDGSRVVVFSSFPCGWCQQFTHVATRLRERFGDRVTIVFKHFPLGRDCNRALDREVQPMACAAAWAAEAANRQGAFWRYHDCLFAAASVQDEQTLRRAAAAAGLDLARWEADRRSADVRRKVVEDVELGLRLAVEGTPTVFLDGRRVGNPNIVVLTTLVRYQLKPRDRW